MGEGSAETQNSWLYQKLVWIAIPPVSNLAGQARNPAKKKAAKSVASGCKALAINESLAFKLLAARRAARK